MFFPAAGEGQVPWYKLHRGGVEVLKHVVQWVDNGELGDLVRPWTRLQARVRKRAPPLPNGDEDSDERKLDEVAECWERGDADVCAEDRRVFDEALDALRYVFTLTTFVSRPSSPSSKPNISACFATLLWLTRIPSRFGEMVEEKSPPALVLVAVYCVLLKRVDGVWWIKGKAENLLSVLREELGGGSWDQWLHWPLREVGLDETPGF